MKRVLNEVFVTFGLLWWLIAGCSRLVTEYLLKNPYEWSVCFVYGLAIAGIYVLMWAILVCRRNRWIPFILLIVWMVWILIKVASIFFDGMAIGAIPLVSCLAWGDMQEFNRALKKERNRIQQKKAVCGLPLFFYIVGIFSFFEREKLCTR